MSPLIHSSKVSLQSQVQNRKSAKSMVSKCNAPHFSTIKIQIRPVRLGNGTAPKYIHCIQIESRKALRTKDEKNFQASKQLSNKEATRFRSAEVTECLACRTAIKWSASPAKRVRKSFAEIDRLKILRRKAGGLCPQTPHAATSTKHMYRARLAEVKIFFSDLTPDLDSP